MSKEKKKNNISITNIKLQCVLLSNNEVYFNHRSLGFLSEEEIVRYVERNEEL